MMLLNKIVLSISAASAALILASCGHGQGTQHQTASAAAMKTKPTATPQAGKVYKVATEWTYPPYNQRGRNDVPVEGLEIDVLNAIAKNQGFAVEYYPREWKYIVANAQKEQFSIIMDGISASDLVDTPEFVLSQPYLHSGNCLFVAKQKYLKDWNKKNVATMPEDLFERELINNQGVAKANIKYVKTLIMGMQMVARDETQSLMGDCFALQYTAKKPLFKDLKFEQVMLSDADDLLNVALGFGVLKSDEELLNKINTGLQNIKQSGELERIIQKWS